MEIKVEDGKLIVDRIIQSAYPPPYDWGYWRHMVPDFEPKNVLMLGVGGGTIVRMIKDKYPNSNITGIENSAEIIVRSAAWFKVNEIDINYLYGDAFILVNDLVRIENKYDLILVDLWNGGWYPTQVFKPEFMNQLRKLLNPEGKIYINAPNIKKCAQLNNLKVRAESEGESIVYETN